jgi:hypothetical protein
MKVTLLALMIATGCKASAPDEAGARAKAGTR